MKAGEGHGAAASGGGSSTGSASPTDGLIYSCIAQAAGLSHSSRRAYASALRSLVAKAGHVVAGQAQPLLALILAPDKAREAILALEASLRSKQHYCKAVLAVYKHAACATDPALQAVHPQWVALTTELSAQVDAVVKENKRSAREAAAWVSLEEWLAAEAKLAQEEYGSARHLLVAFHCRWPPVRGGDLGQVYVVPPGDPRAEDSKTNVLVWAGAGKPAEVRIQQHKMAHIKGTLVRPLPASLRTMVAASLQQQPREALFVSPRTGLPFATEAAYTVWSHRTLTSVFHKPVTCNVARHAYCTALDVARMSTAQLEQVAALMGHSVAQQRAYHRIDEAVAAPALTDAAGEYTVPVRVAPPPPTTDLTSDPAFPHAPALPS